MLAALAALLALVAGIIPAAAFGASAPAATRNTCAVPATNPGPLIVVGHSYGGFVVTNAATGNPNVKALVYIAAYAPAEGETILAANASGNAHSDLGDHIIARPYPGAPPGDADGYIEIRSSHVAMMSHPDKVTELILAAARR